MKTKILKVKNNNRTMLFPGFSVLMFCIYFFFQTSLWAQVPGSFICEYQNTPFTEQAGNYAPYGGVFTPKGDLKVLIIFAGFYGFDNNQSLDGWGDPTGQNSFPNYVDLQTGEALDLFYDDISDFTAYANDENVKNLSKYYYEMSLGTFRMIGEVFKNPATGAPVRINIDPTGASNFAECNKRVMEKMKLLYPQFNWAPFDNRDNFPNYLTDNSISSSDFFPDYVMIILF